MKVMHLAPGRKHDVWALCLDDDTCPLLEVLKEVNEQHEDLVETIMALLLETVPNEGPPLGDPRRAKMLFRDILYELKADKTSGRQHVGLRVVFFFDRQVIVCTSAFCKAGGTPQAALDLALAERARYFEGKSDLEFVTEEVTL